MTEKIFKMIKDNEVKFVDFRFTDPKREMATYSANCRKCR